MGMGSAGGGHSEDDFVRVGVRLPLIKQSKATAAISYRIAAVLFF
jgi:hypothetical protein